MNGLGIVFHPGVEGEESPIDVNCCTCLRLVGLQQQASILECVPLTVFLPFLFWKLLLHCSV